MADFTLVPVTLSHVVRGTWYVVVFKCLGSQSVAPVTLWWILFRIRLCHMSQEACECGRNWRQSVSDLTDSCRGNCVSVESTVCHTGEYAGIYAEWFDIAVNLLISAHCLIREVVCLRHAIVEVSAWDERLEHTVLRRSSKRVNINL